MLLLTELAARLFNPAGLTPHGFCLLWQPWLIWTNVIANAIVGLSYFCIPLVLVVFARRRPDLAFRPILKEEIYALVPRRLFQTLRSSIRLEELARMPVLLLNPATALRALIERTVAAQGLTLSTNYQFTQVQTLIAAANAGLGVAILPKIALPVNPGPDLQELRIVEPVMTREIAIVTLRGQALSPAARKLADLIPAFMEGKSPAGGAERSAPTKTGGRVIALAKEFES